MTIHDTRIKNIRALIGDARGAMTRFAEKMEISKQQVSHILGESREKNVGDRLARRIEKVYEVPVGWLDQEHGARSAPSGDCIEVPLLIETSVSGESIQTITVSKDWVRRYAPCPFEYLAIVNARDDVMFPTISQGAVVFVDRSITRVESSGVFVIQRGVKDLFILRVSRLLSGEFDVSSDNKAYPSKVVKDFEKDGLRILGRALVALSPTAL